MTAEGHIVDGRCLLCRTGNAHVCPHTKIIGVDRDGCFAEYIAMPATNVWHLDDAISYDIGGIHDPMGNAFHTALTAEIPGATVLDHRLRADRHLRRRDLPGRRRVAHHRLRRERHAPRAREADGRARRRSPERGRGGRESARPTDSASTSCSRCRACRPRFTRRSRSCASAAACRCSAFPRSRSRSIFATEVIFKGITIYGVVGRRMYDTWHQMTRFLRSGEFDPTPVITHRFPLEEFDDAIAAIKSGEAGKVIFEIA